MVSVDVREVSRLNALGWELLNCLATYSRFLIVDLAMCCLLVWPLARGLGVWITLVLTDTFLLASLGVCAWICLWTRSGILLSWLRDYFSVMKRNLWLVAMSRVWLCVSNGVDGPIRVSIMTEMSPGESSALEVRIIPLDTLFLFRVSSLFDKLCFPFTEIRFPVSTSLR